MKKFIVLLILSLVLVSMVGCKTSPAGDSGNTATGPAGSSSSEDGGIPPGLVIGNIPILLANVYQQGDTDWMIKLAKEQYGAEVKVLDGEYDQTLILSNLDQLVAERVDMICLNAVEGVSCSTGVKAARAAGIIIISFYTQTPEPIPHVSINEGPSSFEMGALAATKWNEAHPDIPIVYGVVDKIDSPEVQAMRTGPFIEGLLSVDPTATKGSILDGGAGREEALKVSQDMIQAHPEINIFYGISSDFSLAILPALEGIGRGVAIDGVPQTEILVGNDATEAELQKVFDPTSSFKITQGLTPKENAMMKLDVLFKAYTGEINPDETSEHYTTMKMIDYWSSSIDDIRAWLLDQYGTAPNL